MDRKAGHILDQYNFSNSMPSKTYQRSSHNHQRSLPVASKGIPEVVVMNLQSFDETPRAIQALRERKMVILVLSKLTNEQAQRAVDFVAGGTYAIDGHTQWIGERTLLFAPNSFQVTLSKRSSRSVAPFLA